MSSEGQAPIRFTEEIEVLCQGEYAIARRHETQVPCPRCAGVGSRLTTSADGRYQVALPCRCQRLDRSIRLFSQAGIPARYVTGYLQADEHGQQHEASHAWAELFVPELGWVGFDAANRCCPDERYIRLGSGYDAHDAAPIRGVVQGSAPEEYLEVEVVVANGQQQQQ